MRITRVEMMIEICKIVGLRGTCPRAKVGCVIERDGRILVTGYNGSLPGEPHCEDTGCVIVDGHCSTAVHAEENAIAFAAKHGIRIDGANLYTTGWAKGCCPKCTRLAMSAGINEIITEWRPNEDKPQVSVVRPLGGSLLGQKESNSIPLSITDDRPKDWW